MAYEHLVLSDLLEWSSMRQMDARSPAGTKHSRLFDDKSVPWTLCGYVCFSSSQGSCQEIKELSEERLPDT